jgi:diaminopimelate epimerase
MRLEKWQAAGNTFLVVFAGDVPFRLGAAQATVLCDPRRGIGADGLLILEEVHARSCRLRIINRDGSEPEACGNGTRIAAAVVSGAGAGPVMVDTASGRHRCMVAADGAVTARMADAALASPAYQPTSEPFPYPHRFVSIGNPHITIRVENPASFPLAEAGPALERHAWLPQRANIEVWRGDSGSVEARVWERGVGETAACGTGACAVAVAAVLDGAAHSPVEVRMPGGDLRVDVGDDLAVCLAGPAQPIAIIRLDAGLVARLASGSG